MARTRGPRRSSRAATLVLALLALSALIALGVSVAPQPAFAGSVDELVRMAHAREEARDFDVALRRYMEALTLDPTREDAYLGLASLRVRLGDLREAERVYTGLLERHPGSVAALAGRAKVRRALGLRGAAEADLLAAARAEPRFLRVLADWHGADARQPAQLAVWRLLLAVAERSDDEGLLREATTMVRALVLVVGSADPVTSPGFDTPARRAMAAVHAVRARSVSR